MNTKYLVWRLAHSVVRVSERFCRGKKGGNSGKHKDNKLPLGLLGTFYLSLEQQGSGVGRIQIRFTKENTVIPLRTPWESGWPEKERTADRGGMATMALLLDDPSIRN